LLVLAACGDDGGQTTGGGTGGSGSATGSTTDPGGDGVACVVQDPSCSSDADCQICSEVDPSDCALPDFACIEINGLSTCVETCTQDSDCRFFHEPDPDDRMVCINSSYCGVY
jgi:hypothetical protein